MKRLSCECCGAALPIPDRYQKYIKCSFCDATYKLDKDEQIVTDEYHLTHDIIPNFKCILVEPGHIQKLVANVSIEEEKLRYYPKEVLEKYVREELAERLMQYLIPKLEIKENYDIKDFARIYQTTIWLDTRNFY